MIYILEDDESIRNFVSYALNNSQMPTKCFGTPSEFWRAMATEQPELLLLDIMLPEEDGLSILAKLRASRETQDLPIIMLTAKSTEFDRVLGLDSGADDYISKPFSMMELISRIKALLRRSKGKISNAEEYRIGELYICPQKHIVRVSGQDVTLTLKEYELLCLLVTNSDTVFTRDVILQRIWGFSFDGESRTVDVHIRTLRTKLGTCGDIIETVRGIGYKISGSCVK